VGKVLVAVVVKVRVDVLIERKLVQKDFSSGTSGLIRFTRSSITTQNAMPSVYER